VSASHALLLIMNPELFLLQLLL